jgi:hypothetical protein
VESISISRIPPRRSGRRRHATYWSRVERDAYFYRTQAGAELDLFVLHGGKRYGFEFKFQDAPA